MNSGELWKEHRVYDPACLREALSWSYSGSWGPSFVLWLIMINNLGINNCYIFISICKNTTYLPKLVSLVQSTCETSMHSYCRVWTTGLVLGVAPEPRHWNVELLLTDHFKGRKVCSSYRGRSELAALEVVGWLLRDRLLDSLAFLVSLPGRRIRFHNETSTTATETTGRSHTVRTTSPLQRRQTSTTLKRKVSATWRSRWL